MLRHFFNDFMTFVPLQLPQLLDVTTMEEAQFYGDYALLTFPLRDPYDLEEVMDLFEEIHNRGKTIILVTHDQKIADRCHRVIEIADGTIKSDR